MIPMADFPFNQPSPFDLSGHVLLEEGPVECLMPSSAAQPQGLFSPVAEVGDNSRTAGGGGGGDSHSNSNNTRSAGASDGGSGGGAFRVAFRTKSEVDIMDDGFQWRKYGKKSVKNSPNPRNYYRCSTDGCSVKKRVERDPEEPSYVITTYEGIHNHTSPDVVYYATQDSESGRFVVSGCRQIPRSP